MCNLYRMSKSATEVAQLFRALDATGGSNRGEEVYPGYPGLVIAEGELRAMAWGFPLAMRSKKTGQPLKPKPVNNARTDKLESGFWRNSFENRRCLIPVSAFAEAEGERGAMTRTWLSVPGEPVFACAGIWRYSDEWGQVYSMVMTDPCDLTAEVHDRMPVILRSDEYELWQRGSPGEALALCVPYGGEMVIDRTADPWVRR
jgi:putative SOS response-associated peptidase YedK